MSLIAVFKAKVACMVSVVIYFHLSHCLYNELGQRNYVHWTKPQPHFNPFLKGKLHLDYPCSLMLCIDVALTHIISTEITKLLNKLTKEKGNEELQPWVKPCERHLYWSATSTIDGNGKVIWAKFKSFLSHIINRHTNLDDPLFNKCAHGDIPDRKWIDPGIVCDFSCYLIISSSKSLAKIPFIFQKYCKSCQFAST